MKFRILSLWLLLAVLTVSTWADSELPNVITVITADSHPLRVAPELSPYEPLIERLNLDAVTHIEKQLSEKLPNDPAQAQAMVKQHIAQIGRQKLDAELRAAYRPLGTMMTYGLDRYPVIIFDRQSVIYGVTDLGQAIVRYQQWIAQQAEVSIHE